jgi:hypothetical protein
MMKHETVRLPEMNMDREAESYEAGPSQGRGLISRPSFGRPRAGNIYRVQ